MNYVTSAYPDPTGKQIVLTARGRVFVAPVKTGRFVEFTEPGDVRYRDAVFSEDGKKVIALSDESGEFEFVEMPANGKGKSKQLTTNGKILRYKAAPSPDGKWITYSDLENNLYLFSRSDGKHRKISRNNEGIRDYTWSPDSKWIAYCERALNQMFQIFIYDVENDKSIAITTDRANSTSPAWGSEGNFVYFLSDRNFQSLVGSPWGTRQPEPYFDASEKIYHISLKKGIRSPFRPADELMKPQSSQSSNQEIAITIDFDGIKERIEAVPVKPGNYNSLSVNKKAIYLISSETGVEAKSHLSLVKIGNEQPKIKTMIENVRSYFMTSDKSKLLVRKGRQMYMLNAGTSKVSDLSGSSIDLSGWKFSITPREDWEQLFTDAWRMERDYFYDKNMHGVDWKAMYEKYLPLLDRVTTRLELSDLIGRFVGELSALHTSVRGGDARADDNDISVASLGARFSKDKSTGGFKIEYIYKSDPDYPDLRSPLDDPFLGIRENDIITHVDGKSTTGAIDIGEMIRNKAERQVLLTLKRGKDTFEKIVTPIGNIYRLKYRDWEYSRRLQVEKAADNKIGYVHLQAMTSRDISQWYKEFYPVFDRPGLIIDVRHNNGGNIDSFILEKLLRKAWMYWKGRSGIPYSNMPYAFRGHIVILVDQNTSSDGEAFADGFKRLKLGTAIGMRTWGGEIWLSSANRLSDGGLARAPMFGVYDEEGNWLIEGHGFEPDIEVDNLPHATFNGKDAQLEKAIEYLQNEIKKDPRKLPEVPPYPDKSFDNK
ncbi:MAG: S41 family peptidase, partial [Bacteroidota bacterium]